jgi:hypothetical protein
MCAEANWADTSAVAVTNMKRFMGTSALEIVLLCPGWMRKMTKMSSELLPLLIRLNLVLDLFWVSPTSARGRGNGPTWTTQKPKYKNCEYDPEQ